MKENGRVTKVGRSSYLIQAAFYTRWGWIDVVSEEILEPALSEFALLKYSELAGLGDFWSESIKKRMKQLKVMLDPKVVRSKRPFHRKKALAEAILDGSGSQYVVTDARNKIAGIRWEILKKPGFDSEDLLKEMLEQYLPELKEEG